MQIELRLRLVDPVNPVCSDSVQVFWTNWEHLYGLATSIWMYGFWPYLQRGHRHRMMVNVVDIEYLIPRQLVIDGSITEHSQRQFFLRNPRDASEEDRFRLAFIPLTKRNRAFEDPQARDRVIKIIRSLIETRNEEVVPSNDVVARVVRETWGQGSVNGNNAWFSHVWGMLQERDLVVLQRKGSRTHVTLGSRALADAAPHQ